MLAPPGAPELPGYLLKEPTEEEACAALHRVFGAERGTERWSQACSRAGVPAGSVGTGSPLQRVVDALAGQGGPAAVVARSLEIRMRTYVRLAALAARAGGQG